MLSLSSSICVSTSRIRSSAFGHALPSCCTILSSRSNSLMAKNLFCCAGMSGSISAMASSAFSTGSEKVCTQTSLLFCCASSTAFCAACCMPVPFKAEMGTTSQPSAFFSCAGSITSPFFWTISIIFTAMTTGIPSSVSCVLRYRFLSMFVPSTIFKITSGFSCSR